MLPLQRSRNALHPYMLRSRYAAVVRWHISHVPTNFSRIPVTLRNFNNSAILAMGNHNSSTSGGSQPGSLSTLFQNAEANFPPRFREHGWYLTVIASLIGSGQQKLAGRLYEHLVAQPQYQTSPERQALIRRMREAMVKCIILNGIPAVIEAVTAISEIERPEDQDHSCSREDWQIGAANTERAANALKVIYKSEKGGVTKTMTAHRDILLGAVNALAYNPTDVAVIDPLSWISKNVSYGLFLSDYRILDMQETELVVLAAIMTQNLRGPTYWHLRACLRVGMEPDEVEAIHKVIESVAAYAGKTLEVQRVSDVTDV